MPNNPLDALTQALGLPRGFLDALYPFSLYQTTPPSIDRTPPSEAFPSTAPQPLSSPNPLGQMLPPPPTASLAPQQMMQQMQGLMGGAGLGSTMGGVGPGPIPPGLSLSHPGAPAMPSQASPEVLAMLASLLAGGNR